MSLSKFRQAWQRDSEWGRSVPVVPDDHVEPPRNTLTARFDGNHGSWMAPLGMAALVLCVLATVSTPLFPPMTVIEMAIKSDYPGGSGATQNVQIGLWGLCWDGEDGNCSKFRGVFSGFGGATASLPERFYPLASTLTSIPQAFLNAVGVFPIFANAYIYFGAVYAACSCTFFQQKMRRTVKWQSAAIACYHWVIIWSSISLGLMFGFFQKVKENLASSDVKDFVECKLGISVWLMLSSLLLMIWSSITWHTWRLNLKRGIWQPAAWMMYIDDSEGKRGDQAVELSVQTSKDVEAQNEKLNAFSDTLSDCNEDRTLPTYTLAPSSGEIAMSGKACDNTVAPSTLSTEQPQVTPMVTPGLNAATSEGTLPPLAEESHASAADPTDDAAGVPSSPSKASITRITT